MIINSQLSACLGPTFARSLARSAIRARRFVFGSLGPEQSEKGRKAREQNCLSASLEGAKSAAKAGQSDARLVDWPH